MSHAHFKWYAVPLAVAAAVAGLTALQHRSSQQRLRLTADHRIAERTEAVIAGLVRMARAGDNGPYRLLRLNTMGGAELQVPRRRLHSALGILDALFECYALACVSDSVVDAVRADVWNCLCLVVEEALEIYCSADALSVDTPVAATALAMADLLSSRYNILRFLSPAASTQLTVGAVSPVVVAAAARKNALRGSAVRSVMVFARLLRGSSSYVELLLLSALVAVSAVQLPRLVLTAGALATPPRVLYETSVRDALLLGSDTARISLTAVCCRVLRSLPGRMLAAATAGALFSHLFAAVQDAASDGLLRSLRAAVKTDTVLALSRFDYVADAAWHVPQRVFGALGVVTNFSLGDVDRLFSLAAGYAHRCRVVAQAPLPSAAGWATRQVIHWLQREWSRACLLRACADRCVNSAAATASSSPAPSPGLSKPPRHGCATAAAHHTTAHYGLLSLLLAAVEAPLPLSATAHETLAVHTRWPLYPPASLRASRQALEALVERGAAVLKVKLAAVQALAEDAAEGGPAPPPPHPSFPALLWLLRCHAAPWQPPLASPTLPHARADTWAAASTREVLLDKVIVGMEGVPLMAALAAHGVVQPVVVGLPSQPPPMGIEKEEVPGREREAAAVELAFQVARTVEGCDVFPMPPSCSFAPPSAFEFDVEVARLRYYDHDTYAQSTAAVLYVQESHEPLIDRCSAPLQNTLLPVLSAPSWRVTFEHVSFRYPGTSVDVLRDVSFDVAPGGFLGIVGYSGAGKSTLLLLLSRVYAPTEGHISVDGVPIDCIPPRALRRRLGVTWQGDGNARFLEGLGVERNIAYGALHRASDATVAQALEAACVSEAVAARPRGKHNGLQSHEWSGGELERLSVARALMVPPTEAGAYVFDECASGLDSVTEARVFAQALRAHHHVTQIMVSHRLSSVQDASEILVLAHGRVVERGTWAELLAQDRNSLFRTLYDAQMIE